MRFAMRGKMAAELCEAASTAIERGRPGGKDS